MSQSSEFEDNSELSEDESIPELEAENRKTCVGPWRNKTEFDCVYNKIYGKNATQETKQEAYKKLQIWKLRRLEFTPAAILSTLAILEVQLKDNEHITDHEKLNELRLIYSSAFTRFLNFMSSITRRIKTKTMYEIAKELGINTFLVDLRHLCAHGQTMPDLDVFRKTSNYCMNWLEEFFWLPHKNTMKNVDAKHIKRKNLTKLDKNLQQLFQIYDICLECISKNCDKITEGRNFLTAENYENVEKFANKFEKTKFKQLISIMIKEIWNLIDRDGRLRDLSEIYIECFLEMKFLFDLAANIKNDQDTENLITNNQQLFRTMAMLGFIEDLFYNLMEIAENNCENSNRRKGAGFWAYQIANGFNIYRIFRINCKNQTQEEPDIELNISSIKKNLITKNVRKIYKSMHVDINKTLIFGDTNQRPWTLYLSRDYIEERLLNINENTARAIKVCLFLVHPVLAGEEFQNLNRLVDIYSNNISDNNETDNEDSLMKIYTLEKDVLKNGDFNGDSLDEMQSIQEEQKFGIWTRVPDGQDWNKCPFGRFILE